MTVTIELSCSHFLKTDILLQTIHFITNFNDLSVILRLIFFIDSI